MITAWLLGKIICFYLILGGGGIVNQLKKSYSLSDLTGIGSELVTRRSSQNEADEIDDNVGVLRRKPHRDKRSPHRSSSASATGIYFSEVDINILTTGGQTFGDEIRSTEDISSGYSSGEFSQRQSLRDQQNKNALRARPTRVTRSSSNRSNVPRKSPNISDESEDDLDETFDTNIVFFNDKAKRIQKLPENPQSENTDLFFDSFPFIQHDGKSNFPMTSLSACPSSSQCDINEYLNKNPLDFEEISTRGGKYHKKMAPRPPAIKATLVLQPGLVRNLSKSADDLTTGTKQLFLQSITRSKSPAISTTSSKSTKDAIKKIFLKFPKKVVHTSWSGKKLFFSKQHSKSANNLIVGSSVTGQEKNFGLELKGSSSKRNLASS